MKKVLLSLALALVLLSSLTYSQTQKGINYQAVARNNDGTIMNNKPVGIRFSLIKGPLPGTNIYVENHALNTNQFGLFSAVIGNGQKITGEFTSIDWSSGDIYLKVEIDPAGGTNYTETGTTQLQAVPYAFVSGRTIGDNDRDSTNEIQTLTINGNQLAISKGNAVTLPSSGGNQGDNWGTQTVATDESLKGNGTLNDPIRIARNDATTGQVLTWTGEAWFPRTFTGDDWGKQSVVTDESLTGKGTSGEPLKIAQQGATNGQVLSWTGNAWLPASNTDADADPANEIQILTRTGSDITLSNSGGTVSINDADADSTNEIQTISKTGITITLSKNGGTFTDADADSTNEIQDLSISNDTIIISKGNKVKLPSLGGARNIDELTDGKSDSKSVFLGLNSGSRDDGNNNNIGIGIKALQSNTSGFQNIAIGFESMRNNTTGYQNVAIGDSTLLSSTSSFRNTAIGHASQLKILTVNLIHHLDGVLY